MARAYPVFYVEGLLQQVRPGTTNLWTKKSGIKLHGQFIAWADLKDFKIDYKISDQQGSVAGAAAGAIIAGGAGAIVGGMRNSKKVEPYVTLSYVVGTENRNLTFISRKAEDIQKEYLKRVRKIAEYPQTQLDAVNPQPSQESKLKKAGKIYFSPYTYSFKAIKKLSGKDKK